MTGIRFEKDPCGNPQLLMMCKTCVDKRIADAQASGFALGIVRERDALRELAGEAPVDGPHRHDPQDGPCRCSCCEWRRKAAALGVKCR